MHRATSKLLNQSPCTHLPANCTQPHPVHIHDQTIETSLALQTASASCFSQCRELTTAPCGLFSKRASADNATRRERDQDQESCIPAQGEAQSLLWRYICPFNCLGTHGRKPHWFQICPVPKLSACNNARPHYCRQSLAWPPQPGPQLQLPMSTLCFALHHCRHEAPLLPPHSLSGRERAQRMFPRFQLSMQGLYTNPC